MMTHSHTIIERTASHIAQCDHGERWYIHPVKIQWNPARDEWAYWSDGQPRRHDSLEAILAEADPASLRKFYATEVE